MKKSVTPSANDLTTALLNDLNNIWPDQPTVALGSPSPSSVSVLECGQSVGHKEPESPKNPAPSSHTLPFTKKNPRARGRLGELMVLTDITRQGYLAFTVPDHLHYDLLMDVRGKFIRVQCKMTEKMATHESLADKKVYQWALRTNCTQYTTDDIDLIALVAMDLGTISYLPYSGRQVIQLSEAGGRKHKSIYDYPLNEALLEVMK